MIQSKHIHASQVVFVVMIIGMLLLAHGKSWAHPARPGAVVSPVLAEYLACNDDIQVIHLGEDYLIILPADALFAGNSPRLLCDAQPLIHAVTDYLQQFTKISVRVESFTDSSDPEQRNLALSKARAATVASELWKHNLDARLLYAVGHGSAKPMYNEYGPYHAKNERIEITFREIVA